MQGYFIGPCQKVSQKFETKSLSKLIYSITLKLNVKVMRIKEMITNLRSSLFSKTIIVSIIGNVRRTGWIIWMLRVGKERDECHQIFGLFYSLAKEDSSTFTQYTTAVLVFSFWLAVVITSTLLWQYSIFQRLARSSGSWCSLCSAGTLSSRFSVYGKKWCVRCVGNKVWCRDANGMGKPHRPVSF